MWLYILHHRNVPTSNNVEGIQDIAACRRGMAALGLNPQHGKGSGEHKKINNQNFDEKNYQILHTHMSMGKIS